MIPRFSVFTVPDVKNAIVPAGHHDRGVRGNIDGIHIITRPGKVAEVVSIVGAMHLDVPVTAAGEGLLAVADKADRANLLGKTTDGSLDLAAAEIPDLDHVVCPAAGKDIAV